MSNDVPRMPDPVENNSFIPTLDRQGAIWLYIDEITQAYLDFAGQTKGTLLEIAAGYGHIVIKALEAGAEKVFANEIDADQLAIIKSRTPAEYSDKLVCCLGQFPEHLEFSDASFDGIYNARLFHFFDGDRIRASLTKFYRWLKPGGRVFLVNDAVYRTIFKPLIPVYETADRSRRRMARFHKRRWFLHSGIFTSRNIPQDNELHGPNRVDPGIEPSWIQGSDGWVLSVYG